MTFPSYRHRYLPGMTRRQIAALPDKAWAPVIIATGAIEQHGPHLPVAVDALMGQTWLSLALSRLPNGASAYVAPPITIGKSNEHSGFPGTLFVSKATLRVLLLTIAQQVHEWGFRNIAIINTHGGNVPVLFPTLREIRATFGMKADVLKSKIDYDITPQEAKFGIHAGEVETSWILAAAQHLVRMDQAVCEYPARLDDPGQVRPVMAPATVAWTSRDVSKTGTMGNAPISTVEKGIKWLDQGSTNLAREIADCCHAAQPR